MAHAINVPPRSLIERYGIAGPRLTSYPTAPAFDASVRDVEFRRALARSNDQLIPAPLSLYLHIPFCRSLCYHCACNKKVTRSAGMVSNYMTALHREIARKSLMLDRDRMVEQLHIGGGTPTYLNAGQRSALMGCIGKHFSLSQQSNRDFSIEIDPRTVVPAEFEGLAALGFNRVSFGVQDFNPRVQKSINREHPFEAMRELVDAARQARFHSISVDLIYGLPHQTIATFEETVARVLSLMPDAVSLSNYAHLPEHFPAQRLLCASDLPVASERISIFRNCVSGLLRAGYDYIGMDHFALPDSYLAKAKEQRTLQRCFHGYSTGAGNETLGLGASAISHIGDGFFQSEKDQNAYVSAVANGGLGIEKGYLCSADDRRIADVVQSIMCYARCDKHAWQRDYKRDFNVYFHNALARLAPMEKDGLVIVDSDSIQVTSLGIVFLRSIAGCFDRSENDKKACSRII